MQCRYLCVFLRRAYNDRALCTFRLLKWVFNIINGVKIVKVMNMNENQYQCYLNSGGKV